MRGIPENAPRAWRNVIGTTLGTKRCQGEEEPFSYELFVHCTSFGSVEGRSGMSHILKVPSRTVGNFLRNAEDLSGDNLYSRRAGERKPEEGLRFLTT